MVKLEVGDIVVPMQGKYCYYTPGSPYNIPRGPMVIAEGGSENGYVKLTRSDNGELTPPLNPDSFRRYYASCKAAQVDVQREEYGDGTHYTAGPVRTVTETKTRREIVPGTYGRVKVHYHGSGWTGPTELLVQLTTKRLTAEELREAAHLFNQLAEVLDERA